MFWKAFGNVFETPPPAALRPQSAFKWLLPHQKVNFVNFALFSQTLHICLENGVTGDFSSYSN